MIVYISGKPVSHDFVIAGIEIGQGLPAWRRNLVAPVLGSARTANAAMYAKGRRQGDYAGVRQVDLGKRPVALPNYKSIVITDYVVAPGSGFPPDKITKAVIPSKIFD